MTIPAAFTAWAPLDGRWTPWVKPVLFAHLGDGGPLDLAPPTGMAGEGFDPEDDAVIVADLPGVTAIDLGVGLAARGWRPVPLFNGCPGANALIDVEPLLTGLRRGAGPLAGLALPPDAPPVFLLDAQRLTGAAQRVPGRFDNRWVVVPQDFPSGNRLAAWGVRRAVVLADGIADDLHHVLMRWQEAGIAIEHLRPGGERAALTLTRPWGFRGWWHRLSVMAGLSRNSAGGFGSLVPQPSRSHG